MTLPPEIDKRIRDQFDTLLVQAKDVAEVDTRGWGLDKPEQIKFHTVKTSLLSLLQLLSHNSGKLGEVADDVRGLGNRGVASAEVAKLLGIIQALKDDYDAGMLEDIVAVVEANVSADYLGQAEQLLKEGQPGKFDHVPAAVLLGAILEDSLRRLCGRHTPPIPVTDSSGQPKTLNPLIDDLKKAGLYNELKAKQLRAWADIRNAAAHGEFGKFNRQDVEQMIVGVQNFLADYL